MPLLHTKDKLQQLTDNERLGQNRESEYLGAEDIDPGAEPILTIDGLWNGMVTLQRGKENKDVLSFAERSVPGIGNVRPLIINATNRKTLRKLFGNVQANTLVGKRIQLYVDPKVRDPQDGGFTDGIRIKFKKIAAAPPAVPPCTDCGGEIKPSAGKDAAWLLNYTAKKYGRPLCADCAAKLKAAMEAQEQPQEPAMTGTEDANDIDQQ